jgi:hypothetical protein
MAGSGQGRVAVDGRQHGRIVSQGVVVFTRLALVVVYLLCGYALRFVRLACVVASHAVLV